MEEIHAKYYSDKSIAVFGDTKPWSSHLKSLGGSFNGNLKGQPGWIFKKYKEPEVMKFIANAKAGNINPEVVPAPFEIGQPAMSPHVALTRLHVMNNTERQKVEPQPVELNFPNLFIAADGVKHQIVVYTVPYPCMGQKLTVCVGDKNIQYSVTSVENANAPRDSIIITQEQEETASRAVLVGGQWKIFGMQEEHKITFQPTQ